MKQLILFSLVLWIICVTSAPIESGSEFNVPEIGGCHYLNAYSVHCWWERPQEDSSEYRMSYLSAADSFEERREKFCESTDQTEENGVVIESCGIRGSMYGTFTVFVTKVENCEGDECTILGRSSEKIFTCMSSNVKLTLPPAAIKIDSANRLLSWQTPERESSMLSFVLHRRHVQYRAEFRELMTEEETEWKVLYEGYSTSVLLPTLIPGASYEIRVLASMDAPRSRFSKTTASPTAERDWTRPSNILVFLVPRVITEFKLEDKTRTTETHEQTTTVGPIRPIHASQKVIIASAVSCFVLVCVFAVAGYFLPWKRWCCCLNDVSSAKPKMMVQVKDILDVDSTPSTNGGEGGIIIHEKFQPISQILNFQSDKTSTHLTSDIPKYLQFAQNASSNDYGRQRNSPSKEIEDTFSLNDILDREAFDNVTSESDVIEVNQKINLSKSKEELMKLLSDCGADVTQHDSAENMASSDELPSYLMTTDKSICDSERTADYVVDAGIDSILTNPSDVTCMTSPFDDEEEKHKQWQKYMFDNEQEEDSDDVPDYVMHAPVIPKDFCRNMSMFVSRVTEDVTKRQPIDMYDVTKEPLLRHEKVDGVALRQNDSSFIVMTMCPSCETSQKHECCSNNRFQKQSENFIALPVSNRRGSVSDNSIDSGYSPDSPDCVMTHTGKPELLGKRFELRDVSRIVEDESDSDAYMTYVTT